MLRLLIKWDLQMEFFCRAIILSNGVMFSKSTKRPLICILEIGGRLYVADHKNHKDEIFFGPRAPIGINYYLKDPAVEFFGELSAILNITPETEADLDFSIGARYWF